MHSYSVLVHTSDGNLGSFQRADSFGSAPKKSRFFWLSSGSLFNNICCHIFQPYLPKLNGTITVCVCSVKNILTLF